jgi:hypothetical protein
VILRFRIKAHAGAVGYSFGFDGLLTRRCWCPESWCCSLVESIEPQIPKNRDLGEVPQATAYGPVPKFARYVRTDRDRNRRIAAACASGGSMMDEFGDHLGVHRPRVSRIVRSPEQLTDVSKSKTPEKSV